MQLPMLLGYFLGKMALVLPSSLLKFVTEPNTPHIRIHVLILLDYQKIGFTSLGGLAMVGELDLKMAVPSIKQKVIETKVAYL